MEQKKYKNITTHSGFEQPTMTKGLEDWVWQ